LHTHAKGEGGVEGRLVTTYVVVAYDGIDMAMVQYVIAVVYVVVYASCTLVVDVAAITTLKQTCAQARTRAAAGVLPLLVSPPKSGAQVTCATEGAHAHADGGGQPSGSP
jgi:hypothetical protein